MKSYIIMKSYIMNDYPQFIVRCETHEDAEQVATKFARQDYERKKKHWGKMVDYINKRTSDEDLFNYYRSLVHWRAYEIKTYELMSGRLVNVEQLEGR